MEIDLFVARDVFLQEWIAEWLVFAVGFVRLDDLCGEQRLSIPAELRIGERLILLGLLAPRRLRFSEFRVFLRLSFLFVPIRQVFVIVLWDGKPSLIRRHSLPQSTCLRARAIFHIERSH